MNQPSIPNVGALFQAAQQEGSLSAGAMQALNVVDIGAQIQNALGVSADDVSASEVVLVTLLIDDSGSIRFAGNAEAVRQGHNRVLDSLNASKQKDGILVHNRYLNGHILYPYCPLSQAVQMDKVNYNPNLGTPLYDETLVVLGTVLAKAQEFADHGVPTRTVTLIVTDGDDQSSQNGTCRKVATVVKDMLKQENHIIAAMGVDDGQTDFRLIFKSMWILDEWILTPNSDPKEIRRAFEVFSQSAVRASQSAAQFTQATVGGFGTP